MQWVCSMALFLVLSGILLEMIADTKYYKFARWVAGSILLLQFLQPLTRVEQLWERFTLSFLSFDYALGADKVLEKIYRTDESVESSVLQSYKGNVSEQIDRLLRKNSLSLVKADLEIAETGEVLGLSVIAQYLDGTEEETGILRIPTVMPVNVGEEKREKRTISPMELYIRELLAEFYQLKENKIEVVIQEAE